MLDEKLIKWLTKLTKVSKKQLTAKDMSQHDSFYYTVQACIWAHMLEEQAEIDYFVERFEKKPDNWTRAMACGFYRAAYMQLVECSQYSYEDDPAPDWDFYSLTSKEFVDNIVFELEIEDNPDTAEKNLKLATVRKGFDAVLKYDKIDAALSLDEIKSMAIGLGKLILCYPPFFVESQRDGIMQELCADITEDLLGEWPK